MIKLLNSKENAECLKHIRKLYVSAFPKEERVPFVYLKYRAKKSVSDFFGVYDDDQFIGLLNTLYLKDIVFVWYFAVMPGQRGIGYGSLILDKIAHKYQGYRIILNIEEIDESSSNYTQQKRRKDFYLKNGYHECGFKTEEKGVVYEMLYYGNNVDYDEYSKLMKNYLGNYLYQRFYKVRDD